MEIGKLGKLPPRYDARTLMLRDFVAALPDPPAAHDWLNRVPAQLGMMLNDKLGDCTCAALGHFVQVWTSQTWSHPITIKDRQVLALYEGACGYQPGKPATDQGGIELDVLNYWRKNPKVLGTHKLTAFADVQPAHRRQICQAMYLFGGCYIGLNLPLTAKMQMQNGLAWDLKGGADGEAGSWGGHAVGVHSYDSKGLTCITWGRLQRMTWQFWDAYCDEAHALLSEDWVTPKWISVTGFPWARLLEAIGQLR